MEAWAHEVVSTGDVHGSLEEIIVKLQKEMSFVARALKNCIAWKQKYLR